MTLLFFGDNHTGFLDRISKKAKWDTLINGGTFLRRTKAERRYQPFIGLLTRKGTFEKYEMQQPALDVFEISKRDEEDEVDSFVAELESLGSCAIDFADEIKKATKDERKTVASMAKRAVEKAKQKCKR